MPATPRHLALAATLGFAMLLQGTALISGATESFAGTTRVGAFPEGTRSPEVASVSTSAYSGCCTDPDVVNFGYHINFDAWGDGDEITDQLRGVGLLFGRAINLSIPPTLVATDASRGSLCQSVLNGEPAFTGWEYFIFVDPTNNRWAGVKKVGADIGFADREQICFLAAYDKAGNLLDFRYNTRIGFEFLSIERPTADISRVMIGDCDGPYCYQDGGGSAFNCLTFSGPVATTTPLPATITMPNAPIIQGVPVAGGAGLLIMTLLLGGMGVIALAGLARVRVSGR